MWILKIAAGAFVAACVWAQQPAYLNSSLPIDQRADDLIGRMTLEEKASQLVNQSRAIPRLNVPQYDWWSEALHGVAFGTATVFPEPIGLAASFNVPLVHEMAVVIGIEARAKHNMAVRAGRRSIMEGLDFCPRTSTSSATRAGAAARKRTAKIRSSPGAWASRSSPACRVTIRNTCA